MPLYQQGMNQQTPAVLNTLATLKKADGTMGSARSGGRRRKRKTAKATSKRRTKRRASSSRKAKPAKGSTAMKRKMAKLRRMRKK